MAKTRELQDAERAIVKNLSVKGLSTREISRIVGCHFSTVSRILKKFKTEGTVQKSRRSGRPKKFDPRGERMVTRVTKCYRFDRLSVITDEVKKRYPGTNVSKRCVKRILHKYGIHSHARKRKPFVSLENRKKRIQWSKALRDWQVKDWENVVFSDECRFSLPNDSKTMRVWRKSNEKDNPQYFAPKFSNCTSVMFWGSIGPKGVGKLAVCDGQINAEKYVEILHDNLFQGIKSMLGKKGEPFIFQHDNAPPHKAIFTKIYLHLRKISALPWPAQSPNLNIIENVWLLMKNQMNADARGPPRSKQELIERVFEEWRKIPTLFIKQLYASIPKRLSAVVRARGYSTKY